jgi:hypothetical protein
MPLFIFWTQFRKGDLFFVSVENDFLLKRHQDWEDSFQNLYYMFRKSMLNVFYGTFLLLRTQIILYSTIYVRAYMDTKNCAMLFFLTKSSSSL